jgi:chorismate synthase
MNSFGRNFIVEIFGESHGESVGILIDGCPSGIKIKPEDFDDDLRRRRPVQRGTTPRKESDIPKIKSGIFEGRTTGSPILIEFDNDNIKSTDYDKFRTVPRPGQVDFIAGKKYSGYNDYRGGGHFSGRLTAWLVAAGVIAKKILSGTEFKARLIETDKSFNFKKELEKAVKEGDTLGGLIECSVYGLPLGLGEPFFDSVESVISHIVFSVPSVKGIEFGEGFRSAQMNGSGYNDTLLDLNGRTVTNNCGGVTGGLTNGNQLIFRVAMRPPSSISKKQYSINLKTGKKEPLMIKGRHDVCPALRSPVIIEASAAIAVCDLVLSSKGEINKK